MGIALLMLALAGVDPQEHPSPTSRELASWCKAAADAPAATQCTDYIYAVANEIDRARIAKGLPQCIPPSADPARLRRTIARVLTTDPRRGAREPAELVGSTLVDTFDCTSDPRGKGTPHRLPGPLVAF